MEQDHEDDTSIRSTSADDSNADPNLPHDADLSAGGGTSLHFWPHKQDNGKDYHELRWQRLRKHYSDTYLEIFNATYSEDISNNSLKDSQFGSVKWTGSEKSKFFLALPHRGRHDLPGLAAAVETKSEVEIKDYISRLEKAEKERQMFAKQAKNISPADMEAAHEIGEECETRLENAADALAAFQESYDRASARGRRKEPWLVDTETAEYLDAEVDAAELEQQSGSDTADNLPVSAPQHSMFHLTTFLELSRRLFMNMPDDSGYAHWTCLAEDDEEPSMTSDIIDTFYGLVVSLVQRVLQTAIFLSESRIRATAVRGHSPASILKDIDIEAALDVLNMPTDGFDYWIGFVRRSKVRVVVGNNRKGESVRDQLTLRQIEDVLSIRASRGRSRSISSLVSMSSEKSDATEDGETIEQASLAGGSHDEQSENETEDESLSSESSDEDDVLHNDAEEGDGFDRAHAEPEMDRYINRKRRRLMVEEEQDEYMERLDQANRLREETYLQQALGNPAMKAESPEDLGRHPRMPRKTKEELHNWSDMQYYSWWEGPILSKSTENQIQ
ncbi:hypothetical protein H2198_004744 [Neophaeococcomyces mojaviensis]|uniref:Uncharacterized protein n=1 Tax=Neophaeococcomyces mojaviensis TaxID=3383035 RepID=A0ACC3A8G3_9EURO|nr:hypothetical protein H2198_004744 [Knufia sp. JES_112]